MTTTWSFVIDWDNNGDFAGQYDNVTSRVLSAEWFVGMRQIFQDTGDNPKLSLVLNNVDKLYSPENMSGSLTGKLLPGRPVKIVANNDSPYTMWNGWIEIIQPDVDQFGLRRVTITCAGAMQFFKTQETDIELQTGLLTSQIINTLLNTVEIPRTTIQPDPTWIQRELQNGVVRLAVAGDNWTSYLKEEEKPFNVYRAIADVVAAERGRFFFNREGKAVFWNRQKLQDNFDVDATVNNTMVEMKYSYATTDDDFRNEIKVTCHPRTVGIDELELLWSTDQAITVGKGKKVKLKVAFKDLDSPKTTVGGRETVLDVVNYSQGSLPVAPIYRPSATGARIIFDNSAGTSQVIIKRAQIHGTKVTDYGPQEVEAEDPNSIAAFGRRTMSMNLLSVDNESDAEAIAKYELNRRKDPKGLVKQVSLKSHGLKDESNTNDWQLQLTMGNIVRVIEAQSSHDKTYVIIGEMHKLTASATLLETTWYLEPVPTDAPAWKLNSQTRSLLGSSTRLGF